MAIGTERRSLVTAVRSVRAAKLATVSVGSEDEAAGHGLLLTLEGTDYVLTCHHVVAGIEKEDLRVVARGAKDEAIRVSAALVDDLSHPERDAVVLAVGDMGDRDLPWLHSLSADYAGGLRATVMLSPRPGGVGNFQATVGTSTDDFTVPGFGSVESYVLPRAYPLENPSDARPGISGGVVVCEEGVVGLVHFARAESAAVGRAGVMNPLAAWADGWPALANRLQPFTDRALAGLASVVRSDADELTDLLTIQGFDADLYVPRGLEERADRLLKESRALLLLGKARSGKTRIVRELLRSHPDAVVVIPKYKSPPLDFEPSSLAERDVIVVVDNLGEDVDVLDPIDWWERIRAVNQARTAFVATCRGGDDWDRVRQVQEGLARRLEPATVYTSDPPTGNDWTREQGWALAQRLGLSETEFDERFDGTPGSLFEDGPHDSADALPSGEGIGVALRPLEENGGAPSNVPAFTSQFVGREYDIAALKALVGRARFVTITGPTGAGKTRLAFHVAAQLRQAYPDGVWVAELSPYRTSSLVPSVVARAVGLEDAPAPPPLDRLAAHVADKRVLLVLNGCDHVRGAVASLVENLLDRCPELAFLTTCRQPLGARREAVHALQTLDSEAGGPPGAEPGGSEAVELFLSRARETRSKVRFSERDLSTAVEIARMVAGNPLAIELVAGQLGKLGIGNVAAKLAERLGRAGEEPRAAPEATLAAAVDVVSATLDEDERALFGTFCVFVGGFTLEAAQMLGGAVGLVEDQIPILLRRLIDKQLILIDKRGGETERYRILESLRQEGRRRLDDAGRLGELERLHAQYFLSLAKQATAAKGEPGEAEWLDRLERELENLRAALRWTLQSRELDIGLELGANLWWFWYQRSHLAEGRRWLRSLRSALAARELAEGEPEERRRLRAELLNGAGTFAYFQGDLDEAEALHREALAIREGLSSDRWVASSLNNLGLVAGRRGLRNRAARHFRRALDISRAHGSTFRESMHLNNLGSLLREWEDRDGARDCQEKSLTLAARLGASWATAQALAALGALEADEGNLETARDFHERALALRIEIQNSQGIAASLAELGRVERQRGNHERSAELFREALTEIERLGDRAALAEILEGLGATLADVDPASAARAFGAARGIRGMVGFPLSPRAKSELVRHERIARERLGDEEFEREERAGLEAPSTAVVAALRTPGVAR